MSDSSPNTSAPTALAPGVPTAPLATLAAVGGAVPVACDIPPLRARPEDIAEVAQVLWTRLCERNMTSLAPDLVDRLTQGSWRDNLRELRACLSRLRNLVGEHPTAADFDTLASEEGRAAGA